MSEALRPSTLEFVLTHLRFPSFPQTSDVSSSSPLGSESTADLTLSLLSRGHVRRRIGSDEFDGRESPSRLSGSLSFPRIELLDLPSSALLLQVHSPAREWAGYQIIPSFGRESASLSHCSTFPDES